VVGFLLENALSDLISALGPNAASYEAIALKIVGIIETSEVSLEAGAIALKMAQLVLDARLRDEWNAAFDRLAKTPILGQM